MGPVEKRSDAYYTRLWEKSPFTTKRQIERPIEDNVFDDYALSAVMPLPRGGHMVVIQNKKKPDERITILPDRPSDFKLVEVIQSDGKPRSTTVKLSKGDETGTVSFDEKLLTIKQAVTKNPNGTGAAGTSNHPGGPDTTGSGGPSTADGARQPRPRLISTQGQERR